MPDPNFFRDRLQCSPRQVCDLSPLKGGLVQSRQLKGATPLCPLWARTPADGPVAHDRQSSAGAGFDKPPQGPPDPAVSPPATQALLLRGSISSSSPPG